ncbi:MAG: acyl-CoA dehydrogenase family protein [Thermodesulfobacteriota bacterium]|nr:acyl-CoA dehydrogenase family protein [Thermodesulfobacteriota bacterium]
MNPGFLSITQLEVERELVWGVDEAVQIFGGYGYIAEADIEHYFRDAWAIAVELGREEDRKDEIAQRVVGGK